MKGRRQNWFGRALGSKAFVYALAACALLALFALCPEATLAQCPLCRLSAASGGANATKALNLGVVVLLVPPVTLFCSFFVIAYKHRRPANEQPETGDEREAGLEP